MTIAEIKAMITNLLTYQDSDIHHIIANRFELSYLKKMKKFQIYDIENHTVNCYEEVETASLALYDLLHTV